MTSRRPTTPEFPSSPPPASLQAGAREHPHESSPAGSLYTAPSPTQTLGHSSPELPPLPQLPSRSFVPRTPSIASRHQETDTSYYTASWGSPYSQPPPSVNRPHDRRRSSLARSSDPEDESPGHHFGLSHLIPKRLPSLLTLTPPRPSSPAFENGARRSKRLELAASPVDTPRVSRSTDAGSESQSQFDSGEAGWSSDLSTEDEEEFSHFELKTPQVKGLRFDSAAVIGELKPRDGFKRHRSRKSNLTLRQEDVWKIVDRAGDEEGEEEDKMYTSKYADPPAVASPAKSLPDEVRAEDKPLPPSPARAPPSPEKAPEVQPLKISTEVDRLPVSATNSAGPSPVPRIAKKVLWNRKGCRILLPVDSPITRPLTPAEVTSRLEGFARAGYDTRGFAHWRGGEQADAATAEAQNRDIYPLKEDLATTHGGKVPVRIPNKQDWENYINDRLEQKLASLGVSNKSEEPAPSDMSMSRQSSAQYPPLPFSPPPLSSSANSQRASHGRTTSVFPTPSPFMPGASRHASTHSIASPLSAMGNPRGSFHMHRHSTFSPIGMPQQQPAIGFPSRSPQPFNGVVEGFRVGSPLMNDGRSLSGITSPGSPYTFPQQSQQFPFPQRQELLAQVQRAQTASPLSQMMPPPISPQQMPLQMLPMQSLPQQIPSFVPTRATPALPELPEVPEVEQEDEEPPRARTPPTNAVSELAVATPQPRGHRHNISANLERELRNGHYHLEEAINRQFEDDDDRYANVKSPAEPTKPVAQTKAAEETKSASWEMPSSANQPVHSHQKSSSLGLSKHAPLDQVKEDGEAEEEQQNESDIETNPSLADREEKAAAEKVTQQHAQKPSHASVASVLSKEHTSNKSSLSTLNVEAKEFKFNPTATFNPGASAFNPGTFAPSGFSFQPSTIKPFAPVLSHAVPVQRHISQGSGSRFNVAAPAFTPSVAPAFSPPATMPSIPTGDFSFMHSGPSFKPDAPAFVPSHKLTASMDNHASETPNKIFGNLSFSEIATPIKRTSAAIPIVRPESSEEDEEDVEREDEDGRPIPSIDRQKRMRRFGDDGDDVPQFASPFPAAPTPPVARTSNVLQQLSNVVRESKLSEEPLVAESEDSEDERSQSVLSVQSPSVRQHKKGVSSLSATAKPFEFRPGANSFSYNPPNSAFSSEFRDLSTAAHTDEPATPALAVSSPPTAIQPSEDSVLSNLRAGEPHGYDSEGAKDESLPQSPFRYVASYESDGHARDELHHNFRSVPNSVPPEHEIEPSLLEINEVMDHLNAEGSDFGVERDDPSWPQTSSAQLSPVMLDAEILADGTDKQLHASSASPQPGVLAEQLGSEDEALTDNPFSDVRGAVAYGSPIHRLNTSGDTRVSDWDDVVSSAEDNKIHARGAFFDNHVNSLISGALQNSLEPLEKSLLAMQDAIAAISNQDAVRSRARRSVSGDVLNSDADDEDDELTKSSHLRNRSPQKDRKLEKIRQIMQEVVLAHQKPAPAVDADYVKQVVSEALSVQEKPSVASLDLDGIKAVVEGALATKNQQHIPPALDIHGIRQIFEDSTAYRQPASPTMSLEHVREVIEEVVNGQTQRLIQDREHALATEAEARITDLEKNLMELNARVVEEAESRKVAEKREADAQHMLKLAEEELELLKANAEDGSHKIRKWEEDKTYARKRLLEAEAAEDALRKSYDALTAENTALEATLNEYRLSSKRWREDMDKAAVEKIELRKSVDALRFQAEEAVRTRESMRATLQSMRMDMAKASAQLADEKALWHKNDEEREKRYEVLTARIGAEARTRERLEKELERLELQEREGMKLKVLLEQTQNANTRLDEMVNSLRLENMEIEKRADRYEREFREARDAARVEVQRTRVLFEADLEAANNKVNIVRADLESEVERVRLEMENLKMDADTAKAKHELMLEEAEDVKRDALQRAHEARDAAIQEIKASFEQRIEELQHQHGRTQTSRNALSEALEQKDVDIRDLRQSFEARIEELLQHQIREKNKHDNFMESLGTRDADIETHREAHERHVSTLKEEHDRALGHITVDKQRAEAYYNERLALADSKVEHLQDKIQLLEEKLEIAKSAAHAAAQAAQSAKTPGGYAQGPEKVNAQALRESIAVLQEQLQEREGRIERLEHQLSEVDSQAPAKLKERDTEITWLRELLGVRVDDLSDLINQLSQPNFNRNAVRDAAIRIRTTLQMEQQEKERLISGGGAQSFPTLASISNFASPKAVQLAAAIGSWRKARDPAPSNLSHASSSSSRTQTPSKQPSSAQSFLSGLMTPPTSNLRQTPEPIQESRPPIEMPAFSMREKGKQMAPLGIPPPRTPPLLRKASYDRDADLRLSFDHDGSTTGFYDDDESTVDGHAEELTPRFEPFGPAMTSS